MKPYIKHIKRIVPAAVGAAALLFSAHAALLEDGGITENLDRTALQVKGESGKILFENIGTLDGTPVSNVAVETVQGENRTQLPVENWKWDNQTVGVDWLLVIDVSDSMRKGSDNRNYLKEAIRVANHMVDTLADMDTVRVLASAADMKDLGQAKPGHEGELRRSLADLDGQASKRNLQGNATTAFLQQTKSYLLSHRAESNRAVSVIVFSDGDDDGSAEGSLSELVAAAKEAKVHVSSVAFWNGAKNKGTNILSSLSENTGGVHTDFDTARKDYVPFCRKAARLEHKGQGAFRITRPNGEFERLEVKCFSRQGSAAHCAMLIMTRAQVEKAVPTPQEQPAAPAEPSYEKEEAALKAVMELMPPALNATKAVADAENAQANDERLKKLVEKAKKAIEPLLPRVQELKKMDAANVEKVVNKAKEKPGVTQEEKTFLDALLNLCKNSTVSEVKVEHVRKLLGRDEDWPSPAPKPVPPTSFWKQSWTWIGIGVFVLLAGLFVSFWRRKKALEKLSIEKEDGQQDAGPDTGKTVVVRRPSLPVLAKIKMIDGEQAWEISKTLVNIGRGKDNDICIKDSSVSSHHCALKCQRGGSWIITDLGSANGIYFKNRVEQEVELHDGDIFQLGRVSLRFTLHS